MKFNNRENELISKKNIGDKKFFNSRSAALVATVLFFNEDMNEHFVLLGKRGEKTPDVEQRGKWNLICGYLDWDESATEGIKRELWEEAGINLDELMKRNDLEVIYNEDFAQDRPWRVQTEPKYSRQNVSLYYGIELKGKFFPWLSTKNAEPGEVEAVRWVAISDLTEEDMAFNHYTRVFEFIEHVKKDS